MESAEASDEDVAAHGSSSDDEGEAHPIRIPLGHPPVVFALPGSQPLARRVLSHLGWQLGACRFETFPNGELSPKVDCSVANHDVFIICARDDLEAEVNLSLVTLLVFLDAVRGESPHRITVILPSLEYARQDRRMVAGDTLPPKMLLRCMRTAGADRFLTVDLHNGAQAAFCPRGTILDDLSADKYLVHFIRENVPKCFQDRLLVCATVGGGLPFARQIASELNVFFAMGDRFRVQAGNGRDEIRIISDCESNVQEAQAVLVIDDMVDTGGSFLEACMAVRKAAPGARLYGLAVHGYFSGEAHLQFHKLVQNCGLEWLAVTNTISTVRMQQRLASMGIADRLKVVDVSRVLAGAVVRIHLGDSVNTRHFRGLTPVDEDPSLPTLTKDYHMPSPSKTRHAGVQIGRLSSEEEL
jgi:ribose-phosphate pyrophosphokinase